MGCASSADSTRAAVTPRMSSAPAPCFVKEPPSPRYIPHVVVGPTLLTSASKHLDVASKSKQGAPCPSKPRGESEERDRPIQPGLGGRTPLHMAAAKGNTEEVCTLLASGANIEALDSTNMTPLMYATVFGHTALVQVLLEKGANVEAADKTDSSSLHMAARRSYPEIAQLLLNAGADITKKNSWGYTPYAMAQDWGSRPTETFFKSMGGDR